MKYFSWWAVIQRKANIDHQIMEISDVHVGLDKNIVLGDYEMWFHVTASWGSLEELWGIKCWDITIVYKENVFTE